MYKEIIGVVMRTILVLIVLFAIAKIIGKKQISQLNLFDYIMGITIGSIAADISLDINKNLIAGLTSLFIYVIVSLVWNDFLSILKKSKKIPIKIPFVIKIKNK